MRTIRLWVFLAGLFGALGSGAAERPGIILDAGFDAGEGLIQGFNSLIEGFVALPEGRILVWGSFTNVQGSARSGLALLESSGELVESFSPQIRDMSAAEAESLSIGAVARQSDGKVVIAARKVGPNGEFRSRLIRLNADGSEDVTFRAGLGVNDWVRKIVLLPNGKIVLEGEFLDSTGMAPPHLARLNSEGSRDTEFRHPLNIDLWKAFLQSDGSALYAETVEYGENGAIWRMTVLDAEGNSSRQFATPPIRGHVVNLIQQPDGRFLVVTQVSGGGHFGYGIQDSLLRLNSDGSLDSSFNPGLGLGPHVQSSFLSYSSVAVMSEIIVQPDGKIWIGGTFDSCDGVGRTNLARLNADGSLDVSFEPGEGTDGLVSGMFPLGDGRMLLRGWFQGISGFPRPGLARIFTDGTRIPGIRFARTRLLAGEEQGFAQATVLRYGDSREGSSVNYRVISRTPEGDEEILARGSVSFGRMEIEKVISISITDNPYAEEDKQIEVRLETPGSTNTTPKASPLALTIMDDERPGSVDPSFKSQIEVWPFGERIFSAAVQSDGRITIAGRFGSDGRAGIVRLEGDGRLVENFVAALEPGVDVERMALQPDGGIMASVYEYGNQRMVRLRSDGSLDSGFETELRLGSLVSLLVQSDGKLLVCGNMDKPINSWTGRVVRLESDGRIDPSFQSKLAGSSLSAMALQPDGKILVAGQVEPKDGDVHRKVVRLLPDGAMDNSFSASPEFQGEIAVIVSQPDGRILIAGYNLTEAAECIQRLNRDGSLDRTFHAPFPYYSLVSSVALAVDGRILIAGHLYSETGQSSSPLLRLNADGSVDPSFRSSLPVSSYFAPPQLLAIQNDGTILLAAPLVSGDQISPRSLVRLNGNAPLRLDSVRYLRQGATERAIVTVRTLPRREYLLQGSTDLVTWLEVQRFTATNYSESLEDSTATGMNRFYRAIEQK